MRNRNKGRFNLQRILIIVGLTLCFMGYTAAFGQIFSRFATQENSQISQEESSQSDVQTQADLTDLLASNYSGEPSVVVNNNEPYFSDGEITDVSFENYSELDSLGRCGVATACIGTDIMPTEERGSIGQIKPAGWHTVKYSGIDGNYLYNRCHLIAYCLAGENANEKNLITGTRYMNVDGMLPYENKVAKYMDKNPNNHVMYRVTPVYAGSNLVAEGVLMEAYSVEDNGAGINFCVFCYNVQPNVTIDYATGDSVGPEYTGK